MVTLDKSCAGDMMHDGSDIHKQDADQLQTDIDI